MKAVFKAGFVLLACALTSIEIAAAQPAHLPCPSENSAGGTQTLRCEGGVTIVAENGARFTLQSSGRKGRVAGVELSSKALLVEVPAKSDGNKFQVTTPQGTTTLERSRPGGRAETYRNLIAAIETGAPLPASEMEGLRTTEIMDAAFRSRQSGRWEPVHLNP